MEVRLATPAEWEAAGDVTVEGFSAFTLGPDDPYVARLRDAACRAREADLLVAVDRGEVVGCVTSCPPGSPWHEIAAEHEGEFRMLAVTEAARGRGVGEALVRDCEDRARVSGATAMAISSLEEMSAAHRLYRRLGYRRDPARDWSPVPGVDLIAFVKEL